MTWKIQTQTFIFLILSIFLLPKSSAEEWKKVVYFGIPAAFNITDGKHKDRLFIRVDNVLGPTLEPELVSDIVRVTEKGLERIPVAKICVSDFKQDSGKIDMSYHVSIPEGATSHLEVPKETIAKVDVSITMDQTTEKRMVSYTTSLFSGKNLLSELKVTKPAGIGFLSLSPSDASLFACK